MQRQGFDGLEMGPFGRSFGGQGLGLGIGGCFGLVVSPSRARSGGRSLFGLLCERRCGGRGDV